MLLRGSGMGVLACLVLCLTPAPLLGQITDNLGGLTDQNIGGYLAPLNTGLSGTMNSAIFRTGDVPRIGLHVSVGLTAMAVGYEDGDRRYLPRDPTGFTSLEPTRVPTVIGDPGGVIVEGEDGLAQIYPGGFDLDGFEIAVPEVTIGSFFGTRALIRYVRLDLGDSELGDFRYLGVGGQHSISQWIPILPFDLAAGVFVQGFEIGDKVVTAHATHLDLTASRWLTFVQPYVGIGYDSIQIDAKYTDREYPDLSFDATLEKETNAHLTLGVLGRITPVAVFLELNHGAATGVALGLSLGT